MIQQYKVFTRTEIIRITKIQNNRVFEGQASWPQDCFENPCIGDTFRVIMQGANILKVEKETRRGHDTERIAKN